MKFLIKTIVGILVATQAYAAPKKQVPINVASDFKKAYGFYSKGQMKNAVTILTKIVKRYPKHTPSRALLADILAQQGLYANAARLYAKVGINNLPRQSYFNYGLSMYSTKNCSLALKAFSRVPPNAPHYYDSLFYSGVCQMRARRWDKAERLFQLATNVSPELRSSQRQLLIESRKRARGEERGNADDLSSYTLQAPQPLIYMPVYQYQYPVGPPTPGIQIIPKRKAVVEGPKSGFVLEGSPRANRMKLTGFSMEGGWG